RVSDIWFEDGNLTVQARDTQFRVYKGPLCSSSSILKEAVENLEDSKGVDGCPLLYLPESSIEVAYVLRTIFDRWSYPDDEPLPFEVVAAFLRLGRKWQIKPLYNGAFARLSCVFPASADEYANNPISKRILFRELGNTNKRGEIVIDAILLARELNLPCILPAAFWFAATHIDVLASDQANLISVLDRNAILSAAEPLRVAHAKYLFGWLDTESVDSPQCTSTRVCSDKKLRYSLELWKPPGASLVFYRSANPGPVLCSSCTTLGRKHHSSGSKRLWKELPSFFGLPPWAELLSASEGRSGNMYFIGTALILFHDQILK
ncbi:hypothetical protein B0H11DRAFT_1762273, partial [Mycena galericulata]